jgi:hypothetical protein
MSTFQETAAKSITTGDTEAHRETGKALCPSVAKNVKKTLELEY